jgi:hypothetical protein
MKYYLLGALISACLVGIIFATVLGLTLLFTTVINYPVDTLFVYIVCVCLTLLTLVGRSL